jgi:hypothetical protein
MVRWNAGTEHVKARRQTLSPARPKNGDSEKERSGYSVRTTLNSH